MILKFCPQYPQAAKKKHKEKWTEQNALRWEVALYTEPAPGYFTVDSSAIISVSLDFMEIPSHHKLFVFMLAKRRKIMQTS